MSSSASIPPQPRSAPELGWASWLLALAIVGSVVALGSLHPPVLIAVACVAVTAACVAWFRSDPVTVRPAATGLVVVGVALTAYTALQAAPLPIDVVAFLAPHNADVWARSLAPFGEAGPRFASISLDPHATAIEALRGVTYLAVLLATIRVARRRDGSAFLERALLVAGATFAVSVLVHPLLGLDKVLGLYAPLNPLGFDPRHFAPLLNVNHQAGYFNVIGCVALGVALGPRPAVPRAIALTVVLACVLFGFWIASRGGVAAMFLSFVCVVVLSVMARGTSVSAARSTVPYVLVGIAVATMAGLAYFKDSHLSSRELSKLTLFAQASRLVLHHPWFGVGRGAFESCFPSVRTGSGYWDYTHPENIILQWSSEWGVPIAVMGLVAIAWSLRPAVVLGRPEPPVGAWGALLALFAQNLVDFSAEVPGVMVAASVCAGLVVAGTSTATKAPRWSKKPRFAAAALLAAAAAAISSVLPAYGHELDAERRQLRERALDKHLARDEFRAELRLAMLRHPAEPYFPLLGALRAVVRRDDSVVPWVARVLERSPVHGRAHLLLARSLYTRGRAQARLEYRLAYEQDPELQVFVVAEAIPLIDDYYDAMELVPEGRAGVDILEQLAQKLPQRLPATAWRLDVELLRRDPGAIGPLHRAANAALLDVKTSPWCQTRRDACISEALDLADKWRDARPDECAAHALRAHVLVEAGETDRALAELTEILDRVANRSECMRELVDVAFTTRNDARIDAALSRLERAGCASPDECAELYSYLANAEKSRGHHRRALMWLKRAAEARPESDFFLEQAASLASDMGQHAESLELYTKLAERNPGNAKWAAAVLTERNLVRRHTLNVPP